MAVYGERRRLTTSVLLAGVLVVILVVAGAIFAFTRLRGSPGPEARRRLIAQEVPRMIEGLDVLAISHYTDEVVQEGQVLLPNEYQAARQNLQQINQLFQKIQPYLEAQQTAEIRDALETLQELVENKRPPTEVSKQAEALIKMLSQVSK